MKNKKVWVLIVVVIVVLLTTWAIYCLYQTAGAKQEDAKVELIKILAEGVILGILGFWLKYLVDEATKNRENARLQAEKARDSAKLEAEKHALAERIKKTKLLRIMMDLRNACKKVLKTADDDDLNEATEIITLKQDPCYEDLLDTWRMNDNDKEIDKAAAAYQQLYNQLSENNNRITNDKLQLIKKEVKKWVVFYEKKVKSLNVNDDEYDKYTI